MKKLHTHSLSLSLLEALEGRISQFIESGMLGDWIVAEPSHSLMMYIVEVAKGVCIGIFRNLPPFSGLPREDSTPSLLPREGTPVDGEGSAES